MSTRSRTMFWLRLTLLLALVALVLVFLMWAPLGRYMSRMMATDHYGWGLTWPFMPLVAIVFLALIALGIYYLVVGVSMENQSGDGRTGRSLEILKERYAGGEINKEQFEDMKKVLES